MTSSLFVFLSPGGTGIAAVMGADDKGNITNSSDLAHIEPDTEIVGVIAGSDVASWPIDLPNMSRSKQLQILPAMVEDQLGSRSGAEHFALVINKRTYAEPSYTAFCIDGTIVERALVTLRSLGADPKVLVPDYVLLPLPEMNALSVWSSPTGLVAARREDGSGFAVEQALLDLASSGAVLQQTVPLVSEHGSYTDRSLLQGKFELKTQLSRYLSLFKRGMVILSISLIVAGVAFQMQTARINDRAALLEQDTDAVFGQTFPEITRVIDPVLQGRRALASLRSENGGAFLRLSERVFQTVQDHDDVILRGVRFNRQQGGYFLSVSAASFSASEAFRQALAASGLSVTEGGSRQEGGRIVSDLAIEVSQ